MRAGRQRHRITLDAPVTSQNGTGEEIVAWTPVMTLWAAVEPLKGREQLIAQQILATSDTRIIIRWSPNVDQITEKWRVRKQQTIYNILDVIPVNLNQREVHLMCETGKTDGG